MPKTSRLFKYYSATFFVVLLLLGRLLLAEWQRAPLEVYLLDIGQGDAILIRTPNRQNILIDGGPNRTVSYKVGEVLPFYERQIDLMVLTHPDADHLVGLVDILDRYTVKMVLVTGIDFRSAAYAAFLQRVAAERAVVLTAGVVTQIPLGDQINLEVLYPRDSLVGQQFKPVNDSSIVLRLEYGQTSFLLPGDAEEKVEQQLLASGQQVASDILKAGHHGSRTSSSEQFVLAVQPKQVVISVGAENKFGHPHPEVIDRFTRLGIPWLLTSQQGRILLTSDGQQIHLINEGLEK